MPENPSATILSNAENRRTPAFPPAGLWPYPNDMNQNTLSEKGLVVANTSQTFKRKIIHEKIAQLSRDLSKLSPCPSCTTFTVKKLNNCFNLKSDIILLKDSVD